MSLGAFGLRLKLAAPSQAGEGVVEMLLALDAAAGAYGLRQRALRTALAGRHRAHRRERGGDLGEAGGRGGGRCRRSVARLAPSQRALLRGIAESEDGVPHSTSNGFLGRLRLPVSTGGRARDALERDDLIQQEADGRWALVDPAMAAWLRQL